MKKFLAIALIAASFVACNDGDKKEETTTTTSDNNSNSIFSKNETWTSAVTQ